MIDSHTAYAIMDDIKAGGEPASEWLKKLVAWAEHRDERACWYERELALALRLKEAA